MRPGERIAPVESRVMPVAVVLRSDLEVLERVFEGRRLVVARSIYLAVVERVGDADSEFTRGELASQAGVTKKTLDDYVPALEAAGLLRVERRREDGLNLPNRWILCGGAPAPQEVRECVYCRKDADTLDHVLAKSKGGTNRGNLVPSCRACNSSKGDRPVEEWCEKTDKSWPDVAKRLASWGVRSVPTNAADPSHANVPQEVSTDSRGEVGTNGNGGAPAALPPVEVISAVAAQFDVADDLSSDAVELLKRKTKVGGRIVTVEEMSRAMVAVATFNRVAERGFGLGAHLPIIVARIRERPSYDAAAHMRLVESVWRLKWWERIPSSRSRRGGRLGLNVIYGNENVFEQVVQDAIDEKAGRELPAPPPSSIDQRPPEGLL